MQNAAEVSHSRMVVEQVEAFPWQSSWDESSYARDVCKSLTHWLERGNVNGTPRGRLKGHRRD